MKLSALREDLLAAVQTVQYSTNAKGMMPILSGIRLESGKEGLMVHSTDLESYTLTACAANVEQEGVCVVNLKVLMDFLRDLGDEKVEIEVIGNEMVLQGQKAEFKLYTMPAEDFPNTPTVNVPVIDELDTKVFLPAVQKVSRASSRDEKRPTLLGIFMDVGNGGMQMVSTDSYRLAIRKIKEGFKTLEEGQYIIPSAAMVNLAKISGKAEKISMFRDENKGQIRFDVGETNHIIRLIEGKFPKYEQFIPEKIEHKVEVDKEEMLGALKRAALISSTIKLMINDKGMTITSESREVGEGKEEVKAVYGGEEIEIAFNSRFLEDGMMSVEGDMVEIGLSEPLKPGIVKEKEGEDFLYIIMPIRL